MMKKIFFIFLFYFGLFKFSAAAVDIPLEVVKSHLSFKSGGELLVLNDEFHLRYLRFSYKGKTWVLSGDVFTGLDQPDLSTVSIKLVGIDRCEPSSSTCLNYVIPMIEISVMGIPEDECNEVCSVRFLLKEDRIYRKTSSKENGVRKFFEERKYSFSTK